MRTKIPNSINVTLTETVRILRENGCCISNENFPKLVEMGAFPFVKMLRSPGSSKATYWILRKDLMQWIQEQSRTKDQTQLNS